MSNVNTLQSSEQDNTLIYRSRNHIVSTCMNMALDNSNTCIGYKLAFYRYRYNIGMYSNINSSIKLLSASNISDEQVAIVNNLSTLLSVKIEWKS